MSGIDTDKVCEQLNFLTNNKYYVKYKAIARKAMALTPMSHLSIFKSKCKMKIQILSVTVFNVTLWRALSVMHGEVRPSPRNQNFKS